MVPFLTGCDSEDGNTHVAGLRRRILGRGFNSRRLHHLSPCSIRTSLFLGSPSPTYLQTYVRVSTDPAAESHSRSPPGSGAYTAASSSGPCGRRVPESPASAPVATEKSIPVRWALVQRPGRACDRSPNGPPAVARDEDRRRISSTKGSGLQRTRQCRRPVGERTAMPTMRRRGRSGGAGRRPAPSRPRVRPTAAQPPARSAGPCPARDVCASTGSTRRSL